MMFKDGHVSEDCLKDRRRLGKEPYSAPLGRAWEVEKQHM